MKLAAVKEMAFAFLVWGSIAVFFVGVAWAIAKAQVKHDNAAYVKAHPEYSEECLRAYANLQPSPKTCSRRITDLQQ